MDLLVTCVGKIPEGVTSDQVRVFVETMNLEPPFVDQTINRLTTTGEIDICTSVRSGRSRRACIEAAQNIVNTGLAAADITVDLEWFTEPRDIPGV